MTISELKSYIISEVKKLIEKEVISEIDKKAMNAAKKDIEADGDKFVPLGKSKFEKNIDKKELKKAMSPETMEEKVNPWAVCHASTGPEKDANFEKCVMDVKKKEHMVETSEPVTKTYLFHLKHDKGTKKLKTSGSSMEAARKKIANAEGAPESALTFIREGK